MSEQGDKPVVEDTDHPVNRAAENEGSGAPGPEELGHAEHSIFDGKGNEAVVVTTDDSQGERVQATGASRADALSNVDDTDAKLGEDFGPPDGGA